MSWVPSVGSLKLPMCFLLYVFCLYVMAIQAYQVVKHNNLYYCNQLYYPGTDYCVCRWPSLLSSSLLCFPCFPRLLVLWPFRRSLSPPPDEGQGQEQGVNSGKRLAGKEARVNGRHKIFRLSVALIHRGSPQTLSSELIWCSHDHEICLLFIFHSYIKCDFGSKVRHLFSGWYRKKNVFFLSPRYWWVAAE